MVHLRIIVPPAESSHVVELLTSSDSAFNIVHLEGVATKPEGDLVLCDVARRDVSIVVADLRELNVDVDGSIAIEEVDAEISGLATSAFRHRRDDFATDPVVWENVSSRTSENVELSQSYLVFMVGAMLIASVGIYFNQPILIIGAMVVGPDFGPIAGFCVALVNRSHELARRSASALFFGFLIGTVVTYLATIVLREVGQIPESINFDAHSLVRFISNPDFFSVYVALAAGVVGMLSLTTAKSSALVGVLISVATIPAASNIGVAAAYQDWSTAWGAAVQLGLNLTSITAAGLITLLLQRRIYMRRRLAHLSDQARSPAGLPLGRSRRADVDPDEEPAAE
ncbi:MAG TPA: DUF389 domain-containing protein [Solirubrobacterales bacterium]|nr:DUF389 domain-containing protein [Solirubrobacterales bacterium]